MFTGIIKYTGIVRSITKKSHGSCMQISTGTDVLPLEKGGSVAINGVCLTVTDRHDSMFRVDVVQDTLSRTNLAHLRKGKKVNIELPLLVGDRLNGHLLEGHIDGTGTILSMTTRGIQTLLRIRLPIFLTKYVIENGSIGIDGVSLTVKEIDRNIISITLVPFTIESTTFADRPIGEAVNIEVDRTGKYLEQQLKNRMY
jgi:riboflavin synthase